MEKAPEMKDNLYFLTTVTIDTLRYQYRIPMVKKLHIRVKDRQ